MHKIFAAPVLVGTLVLAALTGTVSARSLQAPSAMPGAAYSAFGAPDVARTGAIPSRAQIPGGIMMREDATPVAGTLHLFGARTDATPY